jgi:CPA2 family monovalent cation:H+ antiporter-2
VLASLFFISVGMLVEPATLLPGLGPTLATAAAIIALKAAAALVALTVAAAPLRIAAISSLGLAQVGEFSFLLGRSGVEAGIVPPDLWQSLLSASVLTMAVAPLLIGRAPALAARVSRWQKSGGAADEAAVEALAGHVVIFGFGVGGRLLAGALRDIGQRYVVIELNAATVREGLASGEPILYGDASHPEALAAARIEHALAVVAMLSDPDASMRLTRIVRGIAPGVPIVVRARYRLEAERLQDAGATLAVAEELEASLEVVAQLFARLHVPGNMAEVLLDGWRRAGTSSRPLRAPAIPLGATPSEIRDMPLATYQIGDTDWAVGRTLGSIALRTETGASVVAVRRGDQYSTMPPASHTVGAGDVLYLSGDASDVMLARARLSEGPGAHEGRGPADETRSG